MHESGFVIGIGRKAKIEFQLKLRFNYKYTICKGTKLQGDLDGDEKGACYYS